MCLVLKKCRAEAELNFVKMITILCIFNDFVWLQMMKTENNMVHF